ncbi:hypothetical protein [Meridianimarinicoccus roseus]|uniref:hypothetical protein n=1 Tax=Meridianimarinicoccus roseus TaxID=2072018 RepID=UPI001EE6806A|nr:hypothetical protein [Meridianimarinicoccus roseus]
MTRIALPASADPAPAASRPLLDTVKASLGSVPNLFLITANSPAALEGYFGLNGARAKGKLTPQTARADRASRRADQRLRLLPVRE